MFSFHSRWCFARWTDIDANIELKVHENVKKTAGDVSSLGSNDSGKFWYTYIQWRIIVEANQAVPLGPGL